MLFSLPSAGNPNRRLVRTRTQRLAKRLGLLHDLASAKLVGVRLDPQRMSRSIRAVHRHPSMIFPVLRNTASLVNGDHGRWAHRIWPRSGMAVSGRQEAKADIRRGESIGIVRPGADLPPDVPGLAKNVPSVTLWERLCEFRTELAFLPRTLTITLRDSSLSPATECDNRRGGRHTKNFQKTSDFLYRARLRKSRFLQQS
jgi:hypothetical protein